MLVFIINNGVKTQKEVNCTLNSTVELKNNGYGQANFRCEANSDNVSEGVEIISSDEVSGINDDLEEYQKNPNMTDQKIEETKSESEEGVGKVIDYSIENNTNRFPPVFEILNIDTGNCNKKGKIKLRAKFNMNITKKTTFEIPLSYPASSIKCTSPKAQEGEEVTIKCKVQKDFYNINQIFIEPKVIKKKHREILFIKKFSYPTNQLLSCSNFNQIKMENSSKKYNANYALLKTNNFSILPNKGITFTIFLYLIKSSFAKTIPINIVIVKKKKTNLLRNLDDFNDEEEEEKSINCTLANNSANIGTLNCTDDSANIDDINDILGLDIESDEISGISEYNSNPIEVDQNGDTSNMNENEISMLENPKFNDKSCQESGEFDINGIINEGVNGKNDTNIEFLNPPDTGGLCKYNSAKKNENLNINCQSKEQFEDDYIIMENQFVGDNLLIKSFQTEEIFSCSIGPLSDKVAEAEYEELQQQYGSNSTNRYYTREKSSGGLSGGSITAIVLVSILVLAIIVALIALIKNGIILGPKNGELVNSVSVPQANSSTNII